MSDTQKPDNLSPPECIKYGVGWRFVRRYKGETCIVGPWGQTKGQARDLWDEMIADIEAIQIDVLCFYQQRSAALEKMLREVEDSMKVIQMGLMPDIASELIAVRRLASEAQRNISALLDVT